jgi:hypothetical protein
MGFLTHVRQALVGAGWALQLQPLTDSDTVMRDLHAFIVVETTPETVIA